MLLDGCVVGEAWDAWTRGRTFFEEGSDEVVGEAKPGERLPQTSPVRWEDNPTASEDPETYPGRAGRVRYEEGVSTGHRHHERVGTRPCSRSGTGWASPRSRWRTSR